jgi:hypothetical protein
MGNGTMGSRADRIYLGPKSLLWLVQRKLALLTIGIALAAAGLWVTTTTIQVNRGNQCGADGCRNVSASIPTVAPGAILIIIGFIIAVYGVWRGKSEDG